MYSCIFSNVEFKNTTLSVYFLKLQQSSYPYMTFDNLPFTLIDEFLHLSMYKKNTSMYRQKSLSLTSDSQPVILF